MIKRLYYKIRNYFKPNPSFWDRMMEDWGKEDVFGPWTKNEPAKPGEPLKFYKSYYLISYDGPSPIIETIKPLENENINNSSSSSE